jgi:MarR family transcriptional regulator, organic hydroperoxide resistance regulator
VQSSYLALDQQLCFALHAASRAMGQVYRPLLAPLGLTYSQYLVLLVLWETDTQSVTAIGERLALDSGTLTPLLKRLETAGFVSRTRDETDERVVRISLTTKGRATRRRAEAIPARVLACSGLSPAEAGALRTAITKLTQSLVVPAVPKKTRRASG